MHVPAVQSSHYLNVCLTPNAELSGGGGTTDGEKGFKMRGRIHPGNIGVAQDVDEPTNSIPPGIWGGCLS